MKTVEQHCTHLMDKLAIHDRVELARLAIREGWWSLEHDFGVHVRSLSREPRRTPVQSEMNAGSLIIR